MNKLKSNKQFKKIKESYYKINDKILYECNDSKTRERIKILLKKELPFLKNVICDETNNSPEVLDKQILVARIEYHKDEEPNTDTYSYMDLIFGRNIELEWLGE